LNLNSLNKNCIDKVEAHNPKVTGSSPVPATSKHKASEKSEAFFILRVQHRYNNFTFL